MNKNNGFTLVELLASIVIIAILSTVVVVSFDKMMDKKDDKLKKEFKDQAEKAACTFIESTEYSFIKTSCYPNCHVEFESLIKAGFIADDKINPYTDEVVDPTEYVEVVWRDGIKSCTYKVE